MAAVHKPASAHPSNFRIGDVTLDKVSSYTYLGIELSSCGSSALASKTLANKAQKALFKLKKTLCSTNLLPNIQMKLFDQLIAPICLYGSEIWGLDSLKQKLTGGNEFRLEENYDKLAAEKLHLSFCRFTLGVHRKAQNTAVRGELGKYPLGIDVICRVFKYVTSLYAKPEDSIIGEAIKVREINPSDSDYLEQCRNICKILNIDFANQIKDNNTNILKYKNMLKDRYSEFWNGKVTKEPKMRTYIQFKNKFTPEDYLNIHNFQIRKSLTQLRISAHKLQIERGRYTRPPTPVEARICVFCKDKKVEDELHFLMNCNLYEKERTDFFKMMCIKVPNFNNLNVNEKFVYLLTSANDVALLTARFVNTCFLKRENHIN